MRSRLRLALPVLVAVLALPLLGAASCGGGGGGGGDTPDSGDECSGTVPTYSEITLFQVCINCHSSELGPNQRQGAPTDINFDTYEAAVASAQQGEQAVQSGLMPLVGTVTEQQRQDFYTWVDCGTPP